MGNTLLKKVVLTTITLFVLSILAIYIFSESEDNQPDTEQKTSVVETKASTTTIETEADLPSSTSFTSTFNYIEIINSCGPYYDISECVNIRSGPGVKYSKVGRLRNGVVLKVEKETIQEEGRIWYKIIQDKNLTYPNRVREDWYVAVDPEYIKLFEDIGDQEIKKDTPKTTKRIVIDLSKELLYAYDGNELFMEEPISTGLDFTPTPIGTFRVFKKTPSRYMQGPLPNGISTQIYDLPGVPWNLYFTSGGSVIHGAYWHDNFGKAWSHGCVNLPPQKAKELYMWADIGISVIVKK